MFVTRPMMATRPWATNPVATARTIAQPEMTTTRLSTVERSSGTRAASNVGASEGATGTPSVEAPPSRSGSVNSPLLLRPHVVFEQHRRASLGADGVEDLAERVSELLPLRGGQSLDCIHDLFLRDRGHFAQRGAAGAREREHEAPRVVAGALARDETGFGEARDDRGDRALIGVRPLGEIAQRDVRRLTE